MPEPHDQKTQDTPPQAPPPRPPQPSAHEDPAQERGERIETGKQIARGGKNDGKVAGATEQQPS